MSENESICAPVLDALTLEEGMRAEETSTDGAYPVLFHQIQPTEKNDRASPTVAAEVI